MNNTTGRSVLYLVVIVFIACQLINAVDCYAAEKPLLGAQRIFINAKIITMDDQNPQAEAIAVRDGRIVAVGTAKEVKKWFVKGTEVVDLKGKVVTPGFIETHNHLLLYGSTKTMVDATPDTTPDIATLQKKITAEAKKIKKGDWIVAFGFDQTRYADGRHITWRDLDEAAPDNPVFVMHLSFHLGYANSMALKIAGITKDSKNPPGGKIVRDSKGDLTGQLDEIAAMLLVMSKTPQADFETTQKHLWLGAKDYAANGITTSFDMLGMNPLDFQVYQAVSTNEEFPLRIVGAPLYFLCDSMPLSTGFGNGRFMIGPAKLMSDGSIQGFTAQLKQPYLTAPDLVPPVVMSPDELKEKVLACYRKGFDVCIHANGDKGLDWTLDAIEYAKTNLNLKNVRPQIIHCQINSEEQLKRIKDLGATITFMTVHVNLWGDIHRKITLGEERAARIDPMGSAFRLGIHISMHSDAPVTKPVPLFSMWAAVNRTTKSGHILGPEQRITPKQALAAFTTEGAYQFRLEEVLGSLEVGKLADMAVLDDNPLAVKPDKIKDIKVLYTIVGGKIIDKSILGKY
jgi:predicted amidohydrolase YtcJ